MEVINIQILKEDWKKLSSIQAYYVLQGKKITHKEIISKMIENSKKYNKILDEMNRIKIKKL